MSDQYNESAGGCAVADTEQHFGKSGRHLLRLKARPARLLSRKKTRKNPTVKMFTRNRRTLDAARAAAKLYSDDLESSLVLIKSIKSQLTTSNTKAPTWRDLSWKNLLVFYHLGLKQLAEQSPHLCVVPITFNLTPALVARAQASESFSGYLQERIRAALHDELKRPVEFYFVAEVTVPTASRLPTPSGRPHVHGEVLIARDERRAVKAALHTLNDYSENKDFKKHALRTFGRNRTGKLLKFADLGWSLYVGKHLTISSMYFDGEPVARTQACNRAAQLVHGELIRVA